MNDDATGSRVCKHCGGTESEHMQGVNGFLCDYGRMLPPLRRGRIGGEWPEIAYIVAAQAINDRLGDEVGCAPECARLALDSVVPFLKQEIEFAYYAGKEVGRMGAGDV